MRVLVTGATGFLGSHTVRALRRNGHDVRAMVRTPAKAEDLFARMAVDGVEIVTGDITDRSSVEDALTGHRAASCAHIINESLRREAPVHWDFNSLQAE